MLFRRIAFCTLFAAAALFFAGCSSEPVEEQTEPIPAAYDDSAEVNAGLEGGEGWEAVNPDKPGEWGEGATDAAIEDGATSGEWTAVDEGNNLGFPIVYFGYDADMLAPAETAKLDKVAGYMEQQATLGLIIEGHCDQRGTEEYNRALGDRRANAIRSYLTGRGIADSRIKTISYGEDRPAVDGSGESAWSQNRRGVLVPARMK